MKRDEVRRCWEANADAWTLLSRSGYDVYRDLVNTPGFLELLPDVSGLSGLDIGCGEGHNTRLLARRGARMTGIDICGRFLAAALLSERDEPNGIGYLAGDAMALPFRDASFDFVAGFMSFMDVPEPEQVVSESWRVLRPGGFLQFSIAHPCFSTPHRRNLRDASGRTRAVEVGEYFRNLDGDVEEWIFGAAPPELRNGLPPFRIPRFTRTLGQWLNLLIDAGFRLDRVSEPRPADHTVAACPAVQDAQVVAYFLQIRAHRPRSRITWRTASSCCFRRTRGARDPISVPESTDTPNHRIHRIIHARTHLSLCTGV